AEIKRLHRQLGTTTIYVTHDQEEAMTLGDRVCVMCDAEKRQCASPLTVYREPADRFVASFLGMPPMNFFPGFLEHVGGEMRFVGEDMHLHLPNTPPEWMAGGAQRAVVAGVRPENFRLEEPTSSETADAVSARVQVVEPLGSMMDVY